MKRFATMMVAAGACVLMTAGVAAAGEPSATARSLEYPSMKTADSLELTVYVKNAATKVIKVVAWKTGVLGTQCNFGMGSLTKTVTARSSDTLTQRKSCAWSKLAEADGCGPKKASCEVNLKGSVKYEIDGEVQTMQFTKTLTVANPTPNLIKAPTPVPSPTR